MSFEISIGTKGEIYLPKAIKVALGLRPHQKVIIKVDGGRLIIYPLRTVEETLKMPKKLKITLEDLRKDREELSSNLENR